VLYATTLFWRVATTVTVVLRASERTKKPVERILLVSWCQAVNARVILASIVSGHFSLTQDLPMR
jgi:hypothetical protein